MRSMATNATFCLDRGVLKHERPARLHVTFGTYLILIGRGPQVVWFERAMHIVTVAAANRAFGHRVVERHGKGPLHVGMTAVAELRLGNFEQARIFSKSMHTVTTGAAYAGPGMWRTLEIRVHSGMASEAYGTNLLCRCLGEAKDLGRIPPGIHVRLARSVAALARNPLPAMQERQPRVGVFAETLGNVRMARHTRVRTYVAGFGSSR